jgi:hypothetical protein
MISFSRLNTGKVRLNVLRIKRDFFSSNLIVDIMEKHHRDVVERSVKNRLDANVHLSHLSKETRPVTGQFTKKIKQNVTTEAKRIGKNVFVGTGNMGILDRDDPIHLLGRDLKNPLVRLWRILQWGTKSGYPIFPKTAKVLAWISPTTNRWIRKKKVTHPGIHGRFYFLQRNGIPYIRDRVVVPKIKRDLKKIIKKYSYK